MSPEVERIASNERLPSAVDVVIVGGGIVGSSAAYFLAKQGVSVALVEKGYIGCEQSSRNWGWCRQQNRDLRELPLSSVAMNLWDSLASDIGRDLGFRRCGQFYATDKPEALAQWEAWSPVGREAGVPTRMLTGAEIAQYIPQAGRTWIGGVHSVGDGKAEPSLAAPALAAGAQALGATIHQECAARSLDISNGRIVGVHTEQGLIKADAVLCGAGAWASRFLRPHGISFPQAGVRQTAIRTKPTFDLGSCLYSPDFAMTRRLDGSYTLAISGKATIDITPQGLRYAREFLPQFARRLKNVRFAVGRSFASGPESLPALLTNNDRIFEQNRILDPAPQQWLVSKILENVRAAFPQLANVEVASMWGSLVDCSPDAVPVISKVDQVEGLVLAAGCSGHGFGMGPGIGYLAAQLLRNDAPCVDPTPFRLSRLVDGSKLQIAAI
ncbi:D-amino acid oxidase [Novosphingobium sp. AAP83]|uniref:NAD(P)/FAD-dependent oxidoreductase n=1 Tax=Novosphingobium sp. AAP83 TaxID=1523425 RepID=UPI0006B8907A|nr:FAD-binding oxidoreductase [Novosphingobium sp. AAP83]KPF90663.1 D-amino acid oxidase [Novosphingobium sp. AAP83]